MKTSLKISKPIWYTSVMILIVAFVFSSILIVSPAQAAASSVSQAAISNYLAAQANPILGDQQKIKAAIDAYFTTRYEGQKLLRTQNFSAVLSDAAQSWAKREQDKRDIELYVAKRFDLQYVSYKYTLDYSTMNIKNNIATVRLFENHDVVFRAIAPVVSKMSNLQHIFTLNRTRNSWSIDKDEYQDELSQQFDSMTKADIQSRVDENYQIQQAQIAKASPVTFVLPEVTNYYDRTAAIYYAESHPNYGHKSVYYKSLYARDGYGGDCTNYVSQSIYAGAPKMNNTGNPTNKETGWWYNTKGTVYPPISNTNNDVFSKSWSVVPNMYNFLTTNTSSGPYAIKTTICGMLQGDVIQLNNGASYFHEVLLQENMYIDHNCANLVNYLIMGHDTDRFEYPLTYYSSVYTLRYIHIMGWRP